MLLGQKVILWFLGLILGPSLIIGSVLFYGLQNYISEQVTKNLEYTADVQKQRVDDIVKRNDRALESFTNRILLPQTLASYNNSRNPDDLVLLNKSLETSLQVNEQYIDIEILDFDGKVIAAADKKHIGTDYTDREEYKEYKRTNKPTNFLHLEKDGSLAVALIGTIINEGKPVGTASIHIALSDLQKVISDYSGLGKTGETLLVKQDDNGDAVFIADTRYDKDAALERTVSRNETSNPIIQAINDKSRAVSETKSYRGTDVLSTSRQIDGRDWAIVVEIDKAEAYETLNNFGALTAGFMFAILVFGVFVAQFASRVLTDPLVIISIAVDRMSKGDLSTRINLQRSGISGHNEIGVLAKAFNHMANNLQNLDNMKTEFVMLTSHQLRTPASSVKGYLSLLRDGFAKPGSAEYTELLESAYKENEQQLHLINQILAVSQIESHQIILENNKIDVAKTTKDITRQLRSIFIARGQKVLLDTPLRTRKITGDAEKIYMILENIIANASKYSDDNTEIVVSVKYDRKGVTVEVKDQGYGIDPKDIDQLFNKFTRLHNPNYDASQSSGLGLYLAKMLVDLHGGTIRATSPGVGKGSSFIVWLPYSNE